MAGKQLRRCSTSVVIREILTKTTRRYPYVPTKMVSLIKAAHAKCWRVWGPRELPYTSQSMKSSDFDNYLPSPAKSNHARNRDSPALYS